MNLDWVKILETLKDFKGARFYFIVLIALTLILITLFREEIAVRVKEMQVEKYELKVVRDMSGLKAYLSKVVSDNGALSYAAYLYQPKDKPFVKVKVATNSEIIDNDHRLMEAVLDLQKSINEKFREEDYILLDPNNPKPDTRYMHDKGLPYILVYKLQVSNIVEGEIYIMFSDKPTEDTVKAVRKSLASVMYRFII